MQNAWGYTLANILFRTSVLGFFFYLEVHYKEKVMPEIVIFCDVIFKPLRLSVKSVPLNPTDEAPVLHVVFYCFVLRSKL